MEKKSSQNLLEGSIKKNLLKMSLPTMLGFLMQSVYDIVDMIWVGKISASAVAGVTIFGTIFWLVEILNEIIGTSSVSLISQSYGSGDEEKTCTTIEQTLVFKALVAIIAGIIILIILKPLLGFFSKDQEVINAALSYGYIRIFFLPIMFSSYTVNTALRCLGDAKKPMIIMIIASIINIILDPIFIFDVITFNGFNILPEITIRGLNMGVFGAALATVISVVIAFSIGFWILMSGRTKVKPSIKKLFKLNLSIDVKLLTIGLPTGLQMFTRNFASLLTLKFISFYGTTAVATAGIGGRLFGFAFMPLVGFGMGSSAITGQCLGNNNVKRAKSTANFAALINAVSMVIISLVALLFPKQIMHIFIPNTEVINIGATMIRVATPGLIFIGIAMGLGSVFSGSGHNIPFFISSTISRWGIQLPLLVLIIFIFHLPIIYIWISFLVADFVEMLIVLIAYKKGTWENKRV